MKKKFLAFGLTAAMVLGSAFSAVAEDIDCTGWWAAHSAGVEITTEGVEIDFHSQTYDTAEVNWDTPDYVVYAADSEFEGGAGISDTAGYTEYFVMRSDNYGWKGAANTHDMEALAAAGVSVESTGVPANDTEWAAWLAANKEGVDCKIKATKTADDKVVVEFTNNGLTSTATITVDAEKTIYLTVTGELCKVTNLTTKAIENEDPSEEQPTSKDSPQGGDVETPTPKPDETPSPNPGEQDTSKDDNKPGEDETTVPSPNGGSEEAVKATVVTAEVAKAVAEAAKVTTADGKVLDVVLTATPVEDTTAVAGLIAADKALEAAKVKAFAVLDLELKIGDKKVTYLDNKVNVTVPMDKIFTDIKADETVAVYRVDKDMAFSFLGTAKVAADKTITFATDHFTQYVFAVVDDAEALKDVKIVEYKDVDPEAKPDTVVANIPVKANASVDNPDQNKTGDTTPVMPLVILAVVALGGVVAVVASKKRA